MQGGGERGGREGRRGKRRGEGLWEVRATRQGRGRCSVGKTLE